MTVRFYAQLNDFLPRSRRGVRFVHRLRAPASVKDTIEALGVPHPEVDLILVNGAPADYSTRVDDADDLAIYPSFRWLPLDGITTVGAVPPDATRFAVDVHLSRLASLLRLAGFDAIVVADDAALAGMGGEPARVVLTRDVALLKRGVVRYGHWVRSTNPERQLSEVVERFGISDAVAPFTRCTQCNTPLIDAAPADVADRIQPCTRAEFNQFRECPGCRRVYWKGSHYPRLLATLERAVGRVTARRNLSS